MASSDNQRTPPSNPFVRFKYHIDSIIASGLDTMFGSMPTAQRKQQPSSPADGPTSPTRLYDIIGLRNVLDSCCYSPASLRDLPSLTPNDLPSHLEGEAFTFEDAFEDLLAVTQGQPLPDLERKYNQRKLLRQMFPDGEPGWFFERRLHASGLLRVPAPSQAPWQHQDHNLAADGWEGFHRQLHEKSAEVWGRQPTLSPGSTDTDDEPQTAFWTDSLLGDTLRLFVRLAGEEESRKAMSEVRMAFQRELSEHKFEKVLRDVYDEKESSSREGQHEQRDGRPNGQPDTFDELFSHVKSAFDAGERSWKTLMKTVAESEEELVPDHRTKRLVDYDDHVDEQGNQHHKVTVTVYDNDGNEVSKYTSHQVVQKWELQKPDSGSRTQPDDRVAESSEASDGGAWFWKR